MQLWEMEQLDKLSDGDVALKIFTTQTVLQNVEKHREEAAQRLNNIRAELERAEREYRDVCHEEREIARDLTALKNYLKLRMSKKEED